MQQLTLSGHALYCVVRAAQMLQQPHPDLSSIQSVLSSAQRAGSDEATYFLMLTVEASSVPTVFSSIEVNSNYVLCPRVLIHIIFVRIFVFLFALIL